MPAKGTQRDPLLWEPRRMNLNTADDWTDYLNSNEAKLNELDARLVDAEADNRHMARDLSQLVSVRVKQKIENTDGNGLTPAVAAAIAASKGNQTTTTPAVTPPPPTPTTDPHRNTATPPTLTIGPTLGAVGMQVQLDPNFPNCDESGRILLKNNGSAAFTPASQADLNIVTLTYGTAYQKAPFVEAYVESDIAQNSSGFTYAYLLNPLNGGTPSSVLLQAIVSGSGTIPVGGTVALRYFVRASVAG